jgi:replicative DNA helicase
LNIEVLPQLPNDTTAERCLLCGMMLDPSTIPAICAYAHGEPDFYSEANRTIFRTIRDLHESGADADGAAVLLALDARGQLDAVGRREYLKNVLGSTCSGTNWKYYLFLVSEAARKRYLWEGCAQALYLLGRRAELGECLGVAVQAITKASEAPGAPKDVPIKEAAAAVIAGLEAGKPTLHSLGLAAFDREFGGVPATGVTVFLGVPGSGKSSLVAGLALRLAQTGLGVRSFSYEMSSHSITGNLLSAKAEVCVNESLRTGRRLPIVEMLRVAGAADAVGPLNFAFVDELLTARQIEDRAAIYAVQGVKVILVDYIQNLPPSEPGQSDVARIEEACRIMQRIARRHGMCVLLVSQMIGQAAREDRPPQKSDGMGSAAIDQISDCTIGVYRPVVFNPREANEAQDHWDSRKREAQLHVLKNKKGPCGAVDVVFEGKWTKFMDAEVPGMGTGMTSEG